MVVWGDFGRAQLLGPLGNIKSNLAIDSWGSSLCRWKSQDHGSRNGPEEDFFNTFVPRNQRRNVRLREFSSAWYSTFNNSCVSDGWRNCHELLDSKRQPWVPRLFSKRVGRDLVIERASEWHLLYKKGNRYEGYYFQRTDNSMANSEDLKLWRSVMSRDLVLEM